MGAGYSIMEGNVEISNQRIRIIYEKYCDPFAYNAWKRQLENAKKPANICNKNVCIRKPEST